MNRPTIEQLLVAARTDQPIDLRFTDLVMSEIKNREIISQVVRRTDVKPKETFIMKLRKLHTAALVAIVLTIALGITGTAYAIYTLWPKPSVETSKPVVNQQGRIEIAATLTDCFNNRDNTKNYEIKKGSTLTPEQVPQILQGRCEIDAMHEWALEQHPEVKKSYAPRAPEHLALHGSTIYKTETVDNGKLKIEAQPRYNLPSRELELTADTKFVSSAGYIKLSDFKPGDVIMPMYLTKSHMQYQADGSGSNVGKSTNTLVYVFKMSLPFETYDPRAFQSLAERRDCAGNEDDVCIDSGSVDLYMGGATAPLGSGKTTRALQGKLTAISPTSFTIQGSSGRQITFDMQSDIIAEYNQHRSASYRNVKIGVGDMIAVWYVEPTSERKTTIPKDQVSTAKYMIELVGKSDPLKKY